MPLKEVFINQKAKRKILSNNKKLSPTPHKTNIIAVTKTFSITSINSAIQNQILHIGESRVQETEKKFKNFKKRKLIKLHLIGTLQTNKTKKAVQLYDYIETVDREKIAHKINKEAQKINKKQKVFLQINIGKDEKKRGFFLRDLKEVSMKIKKLKNIEVVGIMTILPQKTTKDQRIKLYKKTKQKQEELQENCFSKCFYTSMGMSGDYKEALLSGSTHLRIGTLLYEKR